VTPITADGTLSPGDVGVTEADVADATEFPAEFVAETVNVRGVPAVKPVIVVVRTLPTVTILPDEGVIV
jgi:hypothetical protein